jgi:hypothetical protein
VTKAVPVQHLHRYIDQAAEIPSFMVVVFTGGECFLLGRDLDDLVERASGHNLITRFVSNGYWATSRRTARQRIEKLVACGLNEANFSTGDFHAKYVDPTYVQNGAMAAADAGLTSLIMIEVFRESAFDFDAFAERPGFRDYVESGQIILKASPWMTFGGTASVTYASKYIQQVRQYNSACSSSLDVVAINPDEHLISCCGLTFEEIEELHLGDLKKNTIQEILSGTPTDFIKVWIHVCGPQAIIDYARKYDPSIKERDNLAHICDSCRYMYHDPRIKTVIREHPPEDITEIMDTYYKTLLMKAATRRNNSPKDFFPIRDTDGSCRRGTGELISLVKT